MNVAQLIKHLQELDPETPVVRWNSFRHVWELNQSFPSVRKLAFLNTAACAPTPGHESCEDVKLALVIE